jgi:hypothetical protein
MSQTLSIYQSMPQPEAKRYFRDILCNAGYQDHDIYMTFLGHKDYGLLMELQEEGYIELFDLPKL